ncbi:MAG: phosphoglycerate dehydrogenase [Desulfomonile tiedjei]|nr:phosphoglycerate dehydrogenase [Desulfomonile tiedjei]
MKDSRPLNECRVLCTSTTFGRSDPSLNSTLEAAVQEVIYNPFGRPLTAPELRPLVRDVDGFIAGLDEVDASVLAVANRLKVIARYGVGTDGIDIAEATTRGIMITNTPGANSAAVAELTIALILALARNLIAANEAVRRGEWPVLGGIGIRGKTVGLIGFGSVGREVSRRLNAFECRVLAFDPLIGPEIAEEYGIELVSLEDLLLNADFVSLHAPATDSTRGMIDEKFLERMKKGAFLINTARGDLIDERALVRSLETGHLRGAALDCFSQEPPDKGSPLLKLPQVIVTPHTAAHTDEAVNRMGWTAVKNCLAALEGKQPLHIVNPQVLERGCHGEDDGRS